MSRRLSLFAAALLLPLAAAVLVPVAAAPALAQSAPPTPGATDEGEVQDSGVGEVDTTDWIDRPVVSADGKAVGTLVRVDAATNNTDGGTLAVRRTDGTEVKVPLQGASFDGTQVVVAATMESIESPVTATTN